MTKAIFTKGTCKRFELFDTFIQVALNAGWRLREGADLTNRLVEIYTDGYNGDKHLAVQLNAFDGDWNESYDCRKTDYADATMKMGVMTSPTTFYSVDAFDTFCFFPGRQYDSNNYTGARKYNRLWEMEYFYYADKEVIIFLVKPFRYTGLGNTLIYLGFPEQSFIEESKRNEHKPYSGAVYANSGHSGRYTGQNKCKVSDNPKNLLEVENAITIAQSTMSIISPLSPNVDNKFVLSEVFYGDSNTGTRGRLGRVYFLQPGGMLDGDIIHIEVNNEIQKYRYTTLGSPNNNYTSFPTQAVALRIE
ncbi:hypothetical protein [Bacillus cereus group sp. MYBK220-1]|uniref:hypothetical protein n=1 Tax=Bacillus cereus group sp. MYBK220-1 TaxID=3450660 RepID=UPI003F79157D